MAKRKDLNKSFFRATDYFGDHLPRMQPSVPDYFTSEEIMAIYKADAQLVMPRLRDVTVFLMREARKDYELLVDPIEAGVLCTSQYDEGKIKCDARIVDKASREKCDTSGRARFDDILDYGRSRVFGRNGGEIGALCGVFEWAEYAGIELPHGARVVDVENRYPKPTPSGYRSLKANIAIPIPDAPRPYHIVELQVLHKGFEAEIETMRRNKFSRNSHESYQGGREMEGRFWHDESFWKPDKRTGTTQLSYEVAKRYAELVRTCKDIHSKAAEKFGLNKIDFDPFFYHRMGMALEEKIGCDRPGLN